MPAEPGTFERLAMILGEALSPLAERLQPENAVGTLGALGLNVPVELMTPALRSALGAAASAAGELPALITSLSGSISADAGGITITGDAVRLAEKIARLIDAGVTIGEEVGSIGAIPGVTPAELSAFASALPGRLLELLFVENLRQRQPTFTALLTLLGVIEEVELNAGSMDPFKPATRVPRLRFDRVGDFFSSPEQLVEDLYGWGQPGFQAAVLLERLAELMTGVGLPVARFATGPPPAQDAIELFIATLTGTPPGVSPPGLDIVLSLQIGEGFAFTLPITAGLELSINASGNATAATRVRLQPPASLTLVPPTVGTSIQGEVGASLARVPAPPEAAVVLIGVVGGSRLEAQRISLGGKALFTWNPLAGEATGELGIEGRIQGGKLVISLAEADGFIGTIMGGFGLEAAFDLGFGWRSGGGVYFTGSAGLEIQVPTHIELGPIEIPSIALRIGIDGASFPVDLTATIKAALGPVQAVVEQIGARAILSFPPEHDGNLGFANLSFAFKPPAGVGLSLDVGIVKGGGYLFVDAERGEYAGALELMFAEFLAIRAIGFITTKNPDGSPGFSLLIILSVEFPSGIQLGFGFTLLAVGGLVGLNRTMDLQALMTGVRTGAIESIMFPQDVVANAPRIISDLRAFFPVRQGTFLIGPMLKLGWGTPTLVSLSVGVIIEIPGNIALVGVLKVALPADDVALILLQVNFAGALEFDKKRLYFFAALFESRIVFMTIDGEMGLLVAWGDDANFVVSVGGFHPRFMPPPLPFPSPVRIAVSIINTDYARIQVSGYFAVTSNSAQFGARADLFFGFSAFSVTGHIGFDALFQFSPFFFVIEISASVSLRAFGVGVFSIRLRFALEGPSPWRAHGEGSISLLFFEISADFDITWGEPSNTALEPIDVLPLLAAELAKDQSWTAQLPSGANLLVSLRELTAPGDANVLALHPVGTLHVRQRAVPLDLTIAKVGNKRARDANRFGLSVTAGGFAKRADLDERFALAQFLTMDDADKLSRPAYERQHGGVELSAGSDAGTTARMTKRIVRYEEVVIDNRFRRNLFRFQEISGLLFDHFLNGAAITKSVFSAKSNSLRNPHATTIAVTGDSFVVASSVTNTAVDSSSTFTSEAAALDHMQSLVAANPNVAETMHVIPSAELREVA
jgi:hypothetical protein